MKDFTYESLYLDYFNNYLTVKKLSLDYGITEKQANGCINFGRAINHKKIPTIDEFLLKNK